MVYQNYHKHTHGSNIFTADSPSTLEEFAKRAVELGHSVLSTVEHGYQGMYFEAYEVAQKYGLKLIYGTEAYFVKDRYDTDKTNAHIILLAKNNNGRKALNLALSEANESGYYFKPRLDMDLILNLPPEDIFCTTACVGGVWKYDDYEDIIVKLHKHFGENLMLEVQYQPIDLQKQINKEIQRLSFQYGIEMIAGMDSHFIHPKQKHDRDEVLLYRGIIYEDEQDFHMDYPDYHSAKDRFMVQNVLSEEEIDKALQNTNKLLEFGDYDDVEIFQYNVKLPTLYPELTQKQRDDKLRKIIMREWNKYKVKIDPSLHKHYQSEIKKEFTVITDTKMTDYFLLDYEIVKKGIEKGGKITGGGRGSSVSYFINTLLGFSKIDRITAKVKMFPSRFMSKSRILETKSLPDLDLNLSAQEPFYAAQKELLGEYNSYPMIAYGTFKKKSAFKMYAKVSDIDFTTSNAVAQQIEQYEKAMAHADDDEKDLIMLEDYIDKQYWELYKNSEVYQGIISSLSPHPCAYLIYDKDIREEIGLIRVKSESTKKNVMACLMDGRSAERYKFLKNDLLKVDVVDFLHKIADKTGISLMSEKDLILSTIDDKKTWKIYENGYTLGVNQVEKENTRQKVMRYRPQSIEELCAFIAAIRPSFSSMYNIFESREHFEYGIPSFDKLIQSTGLDSSFVLYQETIMAVLSFAGFPEDETYSIIKWISKKQEEKIKQIKPRFVKNLVKIFIENDGMTEKSAKESCEKVWKIIEDSSRYGFNASHSYSYAYDSLMSAYYKAHYPLEFYDVSLQEYTKKGNKNKVALLKVEMQEGFDIGLNPIKFGYDNRNFSIDYENRKMNQSIVSWKTFSATSAKELHKLGKGSYDNFFDVWSAFKDSSIGDTMFNALIRMNYFEDYGKTQKLLDLTEIYEKFGNAKQLKKENLSTKEYQVVEKYAKETDKMFKELDNEAIINELSTDVENKDMPLSKKMDAELEFLGYIHTTSKKVKPSYAYVTSIERKYKHPVVELYRINDGSTETIKININEFNAQQFKVGSILETYEYKEQGKWKKNGTEWTQDWTQKEKFLIRYRIVK